MLNLVFGTSPVPPVTNLSVELCASRQLKMEISKLKTKAMIVNFTEKYQFNTRLKLNGENTEVVDKMKILGTIINNTLTWDENCTELIKKGNARMALLRNAKSFGAAPKEMVHLWIIFCRSLLEQSCVLWHSALTQENADNLERLQKTFTKLVLGQQYRSYEEALLKLNLFPLNVRRQNLCLKFAQSGIKHETMTDIFTENDKIHMMDTRFCETHSVDFCNTERFRKSSIPYMQYLLNHS